VSFISLAPVLGPIGSCFGPAGGDVVALVKPQFEAGREEAKRGVVRDPAVHLIVLQRVAQKAVELGLSPRAAAASPITGPEGNREFLLHLLVGKARAGASPADLGARFREITGS
jgi:23S rRNA (cytidine1920-2'-O)/16S rRNA (cytidine1409-2'-O)-methyltransferase